MKSFLISTGTVLVIAVVGIALYDKGHLRVIGLGGSKSQVGKDPPVT